MYVDDSNQWHGTVIKYLENGDVGWVRQLEGDGNDELYDILAHPSGSVFTGGITTQHEASGYIGLIARCDQEGDFDRHILLDGTKRSSVKALALAPDGNILVLGKIALEGYDDDLLLAKVDTDLNVIWSKTWSWYDDQVGNELVVAPDGSIYAAGYYYDNNNTIRGIILKFSATGELLAQKSYTGGGSPRINGLAVDGLGNAWITGHCGGCGSATMFMAGLTPALDLNWAYSLNESNWNQGNRVIVNSAGNGLILGFASLTASYLLEYTPDGTLIAGYEMTGSADSLEADGMQIFDGALYVSGETRSPEFAWVESGVEPGDAYASVTDAAGTLVESPLAFQEQELAWITPPGNSDHQSGDSDYFIICKELPLLE